VAQTAAPANTSIAPDVRRGPVLSEALPYAATVFLSAFLLFLVQPLIANRILPWFGGSSAVWTTCLVFFQSALLAGYAYVDLAARLGPRRHIALHAALLLASLALLPILPSDAWKPGGSQNPIAGILLLLAATIGLPYFLLSTTTPLVQAWYWRRFNRSAPYRLFALSNLASLLALIGYPLLFEPWLDLKELGFAWSALYALFALLTVTTGWLAVRRDPRPAAIAGAPASPATDGGPARAAGTRIDERPLRAGTQFQWVALSAMGSVMLLAVTNHVTQNVASVPFLWVLPLSLYLLSFILCFDHPRWYRRWLFVPLLAVALPWMAHEIPSMQLKTVAPLFFCGMFVCCMVCHGELARLRPDPRRLTRYYLMLALGGALGSVLVAVVAPLVLAGYYELHIALVVLAALLALRALALLSPRAQPGPPAPALAAWLACGLGVIVLAATCLFAYRGVREYSADVRVMERDFYGVVRVRDRLAPVPYRLMYHGAIVHGGQLLGDAYRNRPSDYFGPGSGVGRLFSALDAMHPEPRKVGIIGLGAGVIAAYGRRGDEFTFYEISPRVIEIERREFSFVRDAQARTGIVEGDGRLSLEREAPRGYDVLAIDAFAGDSIPMHLLSREAMATYVRHLAPGGVLVFQATNRFINIVPVVKRLASEFGMRAVLVSDTPREREGADYWLCSTDQILVTRDAGLLASARIAKFSGEIEDRADLPTFTDSHHNLLRILH